MRSVKSTWRCHVETLMAMARRLLKTVLATGRSRQYWCGRPLTNSIIKTPRTIHSSLCGVNSFCSKAAISLSRCVEDELKHESLTQRLLSSVEGFELSIKGPVATFVRQHKDEVITVSFDANKLVPMNDSDYADNAEDEDEEGLDDLDFDDSTDDETLEDTTTQILYPSTLLIDIKKPSGDKVRFQCSVDCLSDDDPYMGDLMIETMCFIPAETDPNDVYHVDTIQVGDDLLFSLYNYLKSRGVDEKFIKETIIFAQTLRNNLYITDFIKKLKNFI